MINRNHIFANPTWVIQALVFFKSHFLVILILGLIAAFGRAAQLRAFGEVSPFVSTMLEIAIQSARVAIFIYALGLTNVKKGLSRIKSIITSRSKWSESWKSARHKITTEWLSLLASLIIYLLIAFAINLLIDYTTYQTCLYYKLKANDIISNTASEWVIILFLKNLSVIPFTLVFNALFLLWITNRMNLASEKSK